MISSSVRISEIKCFKRKKNTPKTTKKLTTTKNRLVQEKRQIKVLQLRYLFKMENMLAFCFHQFVWPEKKIVVCNTCTKDVKLMEIKLAC